MVFIPTFYSVTENDNNSEIIKRAIKWRQSTFIITQALRQVAASPTAPETSGQKEEEEEEEEEEMLNDSELITLTFMNIPRVFNIIIFFSFFVQHFIYFLSPTNAVAYWIH